MKRVHCRSKKQWINIPCYLKVFQMYLCRHTNTHSICIQHITPIEFICHMINQLENIYIGNVNETTKYLDKMILQLNDHDESQELFHAACAKKTSFVTIHWDQISGCKASYLFNLLFHSHCHWIKLRVVTRLFPNFASIWMENVKLTSLLFEQILTDLGNEKALKCPEIKMEKIDETSQFSIEEAVNKYAVQFEPFGVFITSDLYLSCPTLYIKQYSNIDFIMHYLREFGNKYFGKETHSSSVMVYMNTLIECELNKSNENDADQCLFDDFCMEIDSKTINLQRIALKRETYLSQFYQTEYEWI
eukprot:178467_1